MNQTGVACAAEAIITANRLTSPERVSKFCRLGLTVP